jgi:hypothetical protein
MMFIDRILAWARNNGISAIYGSPEQINAMMQDTDFSASEGGTVVFCHLITDSETTDGRDAATVAVYFCRLCDFDFDGEQLLPVQEELKDTGKQFLLHIERGNEMSYDGVRWQYGYDDYAENVAWVCMRVTLTALAADCNAREEAVPGCWHAVDANLEQVPFSYIISTNGTLEDEDTSLCFASLKNSSLEIEKVGMLAINVSMDGSEWLPIPSVDGKFTLSGFQDGALVMYDYPK